MTGGPMITVHDVAASSRFFLDLDGYKVAFSSVYGDLGHNA